MLEWKFRLVILLAVAGMIAATAGSFLCELLRFNFGW